MIPGGRAGIVLCGGRAGGDGLVALLGSDRFAAIGGAIAMVLGPVVYCCCFAFARALDIQLPMYIFGADVSEVSLRTSSDRC